MARLEEYSDKYENIRMQRRDGILELTFHSEGDSLQWGLIPNREFGLAFADIGSDRENKVVIMTGVGENFCAERGGPLPSIRTPRDWDAVYSESKKLLTNLLDIEVPIISAVNGPATYRAEIPVLSDVVLASDTAVFQDPGHFMLGAVPGDGVHVVWPMLLGQNRGRYFMLTGQKLSADRGSETWGGWRGNAPGTASPPCLGSGRAVHPAISSDSALQQSGCHPQAEAGNGRHAGLRSCP